MMNDLNYIIIKKMRIKKYLNLNQIIMEKFNGKLTNKKSDKFQYYIIIMD